MRRIHFYCLVLIPLTGTACGSDDTRRGPHGDYSRAGSAGVAGSGHWGGQAGGISAAHSGGVGLAGSGALGNIIMSSAAYGAGGLNADSSAYPSTSGADGKTGVGGAGGALIPAGGTNNTSNNSGTDGRASTGGRTSAGVGGTASGGSPPVGPTTTTPACSARKVNSSVGLFVDIATGADTDQCGPMATPCKSIRKGIVRAAGLKQVLYVANGTYVESIALQPNLTIDGGWKVSSGVWTPDCSTIVGSGSILRGSETPTKFSNTAENTAITVFADNLNGTATLSNLTVESKTTAGAGESLYGIFARGVSTRLELNSVNVIAHNGGVGQRGADGSRGSDGGGGCLPAETGQNGTTANSGAPAAKGTVDSVGYHPSNGKDGSIGTKGKNGVAALAPTCGQGCKCGCLSCGSNDCTTSGGKYCGPQGTPGCGGELGGSGLGGKGGGSSIGIFLWDASAKITGGLLQPGTGGDGGEGGEGGDGGDGGPGLEGAAPTASCPTNCTWVDPIDCHSSGSCKLLGNASVPGAPAGGVGGRGSKGGNGGGGSGGFSFAIYRNSASLVTYGLTAPNLALGMAGRGRGGGVAGDYGDINIPVK